MNMSKFYRLTQGVNDKGILIKPEDVKSHIKDPNKDYYLSTYYYNQAQLEEFKQKGNSVKGIKEVKTDSLWFDFDSKDNPELARKDAIELVNRLKVQNIKENAIQIYFSGNKGYNVVLKLNREINRAQAENLALYKFGKGLKTLDSSLYDSNQIMRIPLTKHQVSGLFKIPLTIEELNTNDSSAIKDAAKTREFEVPDYKTIESADDFYEPALEEVRVEKSVDIDPQFDLKNKPKGWKLSKWAIAQGYFESGERNEAMMILAATCRGIGYDQLGAYYMAKAALEKHIIRTGRKDKFDKEELYKLVERIYSDNWEGGQYGENHPLIKKICERLAIPNDSKSAITKLDQAFNQFKDYAQNIEKLTVKTGIKELDDKVRMTVGMSVGVIGGPGSGKTSIGLQMLNYMSKEGHQSIIFSFDMFHSLVMQKLVQKHMGLNANQIFEKFKNKDPEFEKECLAMLKREYGNVDFCFEAGQNIAQIKATIEESQQKSGKPVRFIVVDYNELVMSDYSDPTQSSAFVAQSMRAIANEYNLCVLSLFQPSKMAGSPADEITSYRSAKGSSAIEQSVSVMFGISRPGFDPRAPQNDRYVTINCVKNRMGGIFALDLHWDGLQGTVRSLSAVEAQNLQALRDSKKEKEDADW